jgi:hypothetical protein
MSPQFNKTQRPVQWQLMLGDRGLENKSSKMCGVNNKKALIFQSGLFCLAPPAGLEPATQ